RPPPPRPRRTGERQGTYASEIPAHFLSRRRASRLGHPAGLGHTPSKPRRVAVMKNPWGRVLHPGYDAARHVLVVRIGTNSSVRDSSPEPDGSSVRRPGSAWKQHPGELLLGRHTGKGEFDHVGGRDEPCRASCELEDVRLVLVPLLGLPVPVDRVDDALLGCARHGVAGVQQGVRFVFGDRGRDGVGDLVESRFVVVDQGVDRDDSTHLLALRTGRRATVEGVVRVGVARPTSLGFRQVVLVLFSRVVVVVAVVVVTVVTVVTVVIAVVVVVVVVVVLVVLVTVVELVMAGTFCECTRPPQGR